MKFLKYLLPVAVLLVISLGVGSHYYNTTVNERAQDFNAERFNEINYTEDDLRLFSDIAFNRKGERIRRWHSDIKVEIIDARKLNEKSIKEVDSVIAILAPLIAPVKIERVDRNGNVLVYREVIKAPVTGRAKAIPLYLNGLARINEVSGNSWEIKKGHIYTGRSASTQTLMHEFEHVLGLEHPFRLYEYYMTIARSVVPQDYTVYGGWLRFQGMPYYLSEQEKASIRMLYSSEIKAGLHKNVFMEKMGLDW